MAAMLTTAMPTMPTTQMLATEYGESLTPCGTTRLTEVRMMRPCEKNPNATGQRMSDRTWLMRLTKYVMRQGVPRRVMPCGPDR